MEIMANSDNVMRGGLTPKYVNVDELLAILDFTPVVGADYADGGVARVWRYPTPAPEFALWRIEPQGSGIGSRGNHRPHLPCDLTVSSLPSRAPQH